MLVQRTGLYTNQDSSSVSHVANGLVRSQCDNTTRMHLVDIKPRLPTFSGEPVTWEPFLMQLQLMSRSYGWSDTKFRDQLMFTLKGEALSFAFHLPRHVRENTKRLLSAMVQRFGQSLLAETHRAALNDIKKLSTETIQQYSARVSQLMSRAYPGTQGTTLFQTLTVEHMLNVLPDTRLAYETLVRKPEALSQAVDMIVWQETCQTVIYGSKQNDQQTDTKKSSHKGTQTELYQFAENSVAEQTRTISNVSSTTTDSVRGPCNKQSQVRKHTNPSATRGKELDHPTHTTLRKSKCFKCRIRGHRADVCPVQMPDNRTR